MASIKFDFTGDNSNVLNALRGVQTGVRETAKEVESNGESIEQMFKRVRTAAAASLAGFSIKEFVTKCASIRGEFQQLEVAFQTMLGNAEQAQTMMTELTQLAATTPFDMKGVTEGAKQLLAYGVAANDVVDTMRRLGDIAAGLSLPLTDLAWLYGTTLTQGRMFTMDLRQFQARGIPMAEELAKIFGVTKNEVAGLVTAGKVTSTEVTQAIQNMTAAGSKFGGLMEAQSHTITGQWSNIQDTIEMAFNDLGKSQEGVINDALSFTSLLVDHWREIGTAVLSVAAAYGTYKAALVATTAVQSAQRNYRTNTETKMLDEEITKYRELIPEKENAKNADLQEAVAKGKLTAAQAELIASKREELQLTKQQAAVSGLEGNLDEQIASLQALKAASESKLDDDLREAVLSGQITEAQAKEIQSKRELLTALNQEAEARVANLQIKAQEAKEAYDTAVREQAAASTDVENAEARVKAARERLQAALEAGDAEEQSAAQTDLKNAVDKEAEATERLKAASEQVSTLATEANSTAEAANTAQTQLNTVQTGVNTTTTSANTTAIAANTIASRAAAAAHAVFAAAINSVKTAWNSMKAAMMTNPIGVVLGAVSLAAGVIATFTSSENDASNASERFGKAMKDATANVDTLYAVLETTTEESNVHKQAVDELAKVAEEYGIKIDNEIDKTTQLIGKKAELIAKIKEEAIARQEANDADTISNDYQDAIDKAQENLIDDMSSEMTDAQKNQFANYIDAEEIEKTTEAYGKLQKAYDEYQKAQIAGGDTIDDTYQKAYNQALDEYKKTYSDLTTAVERYTKNLGLSDRAVKKNKEALDDNIKSYSEARIKYNQQNAANEAAVQAIRKTNKELAEQRAANDETSASVERLAYWHDKNKESQENDAKSTSAFGDSVAKWVENIVDSNKAEQALSDINLTGSKFNTTLKSVDTTITQSDSSFGSFGLKIKETGKDFSLFDKQLLNGSTDILGFNSQLPQLGDNAQTAGQALSDMVPSDLDPSDAFISLLNLQQEVEDKITWVNTHKVDVQTDNTRLTALNLLLDEIKKKIGEINNEMASPDGKNSVAERIKTLQEEAAKLASNTDAASVKKYAAIQKQIEALQSKTAQSIYKQGEKDKKNAQQKAQQAQKDAQQAQKDAANYSNLQKRLAKEGARSQADMEYERRQAVLDAQKDSAQKELDQAQLNYEKAMTEIDRWYDDLKEEKIEKAKQLFEANPKNKGKIFNRNTVDTSYTEEEINTRTAREQAALYQLQETKLNLQKEELDALRDYLKQYGSLEQQRLAIEQEYADKIANARTEGEKKSLEKEKETTLAELSYKNLTAGIDWKALFNGLGSMSTQMMKVMRDKLTAFTKTKDFQTAGTQTQQDVVELLKEMRKYLGNDQTSTVETLVKALGDFEKAYADLQNAQEDEKAANTELQWADALHKSGRMTEEEYQEYVKAADDAGQATVNATEKLHSLGATLNDVADEVANPISEVAKRLENLKGMKGVEGFSDVQSAVGAIDAYKGDLQTDIAQKTKEGESVGMENALLKTVVPTLTDIAGAATGLLSSTIGFIAQIPQLILALVNAIKNMVTNMLNKITELISFDWLRDFVVSITDAIGNLINAIFDLPENIYHALEGIVVDGVGTLLNTIVGRVGNVISLGALSSKGPASWFSGSNAAEVAKTIERLTERNKLLEQSIDDLKETIDKTTGINAIKASEEAETLQKETNQNYLDIARAQARYSGSHHSWNNYWGGFSSVELAKLRSQFKAAGYANEGWSGSLWDLSPEQMKILRSNVDIWERIQKTGKGGYGKRLTEKLDDYIEQAGKLEEITDQLKETLTTTTSENVFDDFLNSLYDLADGSEDVFDDIATSWQKMVNKMVINNVIAEKFQDKINAWYDDVADLSKKFTEGKISEGEYKKRLAALQTEYAGMVSDAQKEVEYYKQAGIIQATNQEQSASAKGAADITYDQANLLTNLGTARNIIIQRISDSIETAMASMSLLLSVASSNNSVLSEVRNLIVFGNSYLEDIAKYNKSIYMEFSVKIDQVNRNLEQLI